MKILTNKYLVVLFCIGLFQSLSFASALNSNEQGALAVEHRSKPQVAKIADKREFRAVLSDANSMNEVTARDFQSNDSSEIVISRDGASFLKIHFSEFYIPEGSEIIVRNPQGTQQHVYGADVGTARTYDTAAGDDGVRSFSALSIIGDTAIVEYLPNGNEGEPYTVEVDYILQGYSEEEFDQAAAEDFTIETTCGDNNRLDVQCYAGSHPEEFDRSRPVARFLIGSGGFCTSWRVGSDNRMFTNNHCVATQAVLQNSEVWFNYQRNSCGGSSVATPTIVSASTILATDFVYDYTLFTVNNFNSIQSYGYFGLDVRGTSFGEQIFIPQHGAANPKELAIEDDNTSAYDYCHVVNPNRSARGPDSDMTYNCDTTGGSSGSPVVASSSKNVIALHHLGGGCAINGPNSGARIENIWPEVASHFNGVIPTGDNASVSHQIPGRVEAENFSSHLGTQSQTTSDTGGGQNVGWINDGDYLAFSVDVTTSGSYQIDFRVSSPFGGSSIQLSSNGGPLATVDVPNTGGWQNWATVDTEVNLNAGAQTLRLDFVGGSGYLMNINWFEASLDTNTPTEREVVIQKVNTSFAIDGNNGAIEGQQIYLYATNTNNVNQQWMELNHGGDFYSYRKANTQLCLDGGEGGDDSQPVTLEACDENDFDQHWRRVSLGGSNYRLEKRNAPGYSIDGNWGGENLQDIYLWSSSDSNINQQWQFIVNSN